MLSWLSKGKTNRDIAQILGLSPRTVDKHLEQIYAKLGVENRTAAAAIATSAAAGAITETLWRIRAKAGVGWIPVHAKKTRQTESPGPDSCQNQSGSRRALSESHSDTSPRGPDHAATLPGGAEQQLESGRHLGLTR